MCDKKLKTFCVQAEILIELELKAEDGYDAQKKALKWIEENKKNASNWDWDFTVDGPMEEEALTESEKIKEVALGLDKKYQTRKE